MAVIEGLVRAPFYLLTGLLLLLHALLTCRQHTALRASLYLREGLLFLAATLSLLLPGAALLIYRQFHAEAEEWDLSALPTLLGRVDPRRFYVFSYGQGGLAANVCFNKDLGK